MSQAPTDHALATGAADEACKKERKNEPKKWFEPGEADMNSSEVLFCALLLTKDAESAPDGRSSLEHWSSAVLSEEKHALELEAAWKPRTDKRTAIDYFGPLERVFKRSWPYAELDTVGLAMQAWRRDGQYDGLTGELLHNYLVRTPLACRTCKKTAPPKRWRSWAVVKIGRLLYESAPALRKLLKLDVASEEAKSLHVVAAERAERISSLEAELEEQHAAAQHVQDAWRKAAGRLKKTHGAVTQARREERAKLSAKLSEERKALKPRAREEAEAKVADNIERVNRLRNEANARAREAEKKVRACERKIGRLEKTIEKMEEEDSDEAPESPEPDEPDEPASKISRRDERGRFTGIPWEVRPLIYGQHARRTPPSAINANITQVLKVFAEEKVIPLPALDELRRMRGELTVAGEAMAAMRVALAKRIMSFGFDESTKFGMGLLSSNTQIEEMDGTVTDVVQRGATLTAGGTSDEIAIRQVDRHQDLLAQPPPPPRLEGGARAPVWRRLMGGRRRTGPLTDWHASTVGADGDHGRHLQRRAQGEAHRRGSGTGGRQGQVRRGGVGGDERG